MAEHKTGISLPSESLSSAMDAAWASTEGGSAPEEVDDEPALRAAPAADEPAPEKGEGDEPAVSPDDSERGPDAGDDRGAGDGGKKPAVEPATHALTPEEDTLLRRSGYNEDGLAEFQKYPIEQRNFLLSGLRDLQARVNRVYGVPAEKRAEAAEREFGAPQANQAPLPPAEALAQARQSIRNRIAPPKAAVTDFAKSQGLDGEAVEKLFGAFADNVADQLAPVEQERLQRQQRDVAGAAAQEQRGRTEFAAGFKDARTALVKDFPQLADEKAWKEIVDPGFADGFTASRYETLLRSGKTVGEALKQTYKEAATLRFTNDTKKAQERADSQQKAIRGAGEPSASSSARTSASRNRAPRTATEAMNAAFAEVEAAQR